MSNDMNTPDSGPDKTAPDVKKSELKDAIEIIGEIFYASNRVEVGYDFREVIELKLTKSGRWVRVQLEEIDDPTPKEKAEYLQSLED